MTAWPWLVGAAVAAAGSYLAGWPAWRASRDRAARDLNAERYLAWRGRADRGPRSSGITRPERQRLVIGALLALVAAFCLVGFFTYA
jgi:drug/metabolite transporter (DMT)-like permease